MILSNTCSKALHALTMSIRGLRRFVEVRLLIPAKILVIRFLYRVGLLLRVFTWRYWRHHVRALVSLVFILVAAFAAALAVGSWTSAGNAETGQACTELPSTAGYADLGTVTEDRFDGIPGEETVLHGYQGENELLVFASFVERDHPYACWRENIQTGQTFDTYIDLDNDCIFETYVAHGESDRSYDLKSWGF